MASGARFLRRHWVISDYVAYHVVVVVVALLLHSWSIGLCGTIPSLVQPAVMLGIYCISEGPRFVWEALTDG